MKCDRCGKEIPDTGLYCGRCGKAVFPEYMDEDDRWAYYKTDEELEEILKAEQEGKEAEPAKPVKITRLPKEKENVEEPVQEEVLQTEEEPEEVKTEVAEEAEAEVEEASVAESETHLEAETEVETETEAEAAPELNAEPQTEYPETQEVKEQEEEQAVLEEISEDASQEEENVWEEDLFEDEDDEEEDEKPPLSPERKKKRWKITALITLFLLLCLGIGIALGMKRMKDLDRQEKEYYEKLHKEVVHQDTPSSETEKEMDEEEKEDTSKEETPEQKSFELVNPEEIDFSQYQKITPVSAEQNSIKESDTYDYSAKSAIDGDSTTSWQENEEGTGETTGIQINLDGNHKVRYLVLYLGNWRSDQLWEYSARPKTLTIQIGDSQTKDVEFSDEKKKFCLSFDEPIDASYISMYIADSYEGSRWSDNGISEVEIYE
ncbi:MAG: discoidin domain-containing protein [Bacillota bacterium]|nr:discoidin domain-containing protein [Bacillota bacterium]